MRFLSYDQPVARRELPEKAEFRLKALRVLLDEGGYSDVVREAQEIVELALKGMLRAVGIEPPKFHDVGDILKQHRLLFVDAVRDHLDRLAEISKALRKDRELAFYGDVDFIPTEEYDLAQANEAQAGAEYAVQTARLVFQKRGSP